MKKIIVLISLLIIVFSMSGCTKGRLDEFPPRAFDEEYIKSSSEKGAEIGTLTADYIKNVLSVLGFEFKSGAEIGEEIGNKIPSVGDIEKELDKVLPTEGEILDAVEKATDKIPSVGEIEEKLDEVLPTEAEILNKVEEVSEDLDGKLKQSVEAFAESVN